LECEEAFNDSREFEITNVPFDEFKLRIKSNVGSAPKDWISYSPAGSVAPETMKLKGTFALMWTVWALAAAVISRSKAIVIANRFLFTIFSFFAFRHG